MADKPVNEILDVEQTEKTFVPDAAAGDKAVALRAGAPCLIVLTGKAVGMMFKLGTEEVTIGRSREAKVSLDDPSISRLHARVSFYNNTLYIRDLNSTNGTFINGKKTAFRKIADGDKIQLGETCILKFTYQDELEENFQKHLYDSATRDCLTKIFNKKYFQERLISEFTFANRHKTTLSIVMFDIDHFKVINDTHGHVAGDYILKCVADIVLGIIRKEDIFCRYGGEEFVLLLRSISPQQALLFAERMRKTIECNSLVYQGESIPVTVSVGLTTLQDHNFQDPETFIKEADAYLYQAKKSGRNAVRSPLTATAASGQGHSEAPIP